MWVLAVILIVLFSPTIFGAVLAVIFKRPPADMLALLTSSFLLFMGQLIFQTFNTSWCADISFLSKDVHATTLLAGVLVSVTMSLMIPFILAEWGIRAVDRFRRKHHAFLRQESKGNRIPVILISVCFVSIIVLTLPTLIEAGSAGFRAGRQEALRRHAVENKQPLTGAAIPPPPAGR